MLVARGSAHRELVERLAAALMVPLTVWTDHGEAAAFESMVAAGAARVVIQKAALDDPDRIAGLSREFGVEAVAVAITAGGEDEGWRVYDGRDGQPTEWDAVTWARVVEAQNGGLIVVESPGGGPHGEPFDLQLLAAITGAVARPVLAAGEPEGIEDLFDALMIGNVSGVLVSSLVHSGEVTIPEIRAFLREHGLV